MAGTPSSYGPPMVRAEGGPKIFLLKSSWRRSKIMAVSLKYWPRRREGGLGGGGGGSSYGVRPIAGERLSGAGTHRSPTVGLLPQQVFRVQILLELRAIRDEDLVRLQVRHEGRQLP